MAGAALQKDTAWEWTPKKERAAVACAEHDTKVKQAEEAGVARTTLDRWLEEPEFVARVDELLATGRERARWRYFRKVDALVEKEINIALYGTPRHSVQLAACKQVLDRIGFKSAEKIEHEHTGKDGADLPLTIQINAIDYRAVVAAITTRPDGDRFASGEDQGVVDGEALGQDRDGRRYLLGDGESGR